ncbi:MAG: hypothetical protein GOMPHAMPRED_006276 [Gomphillus americanus]|uniref:NAD(P)-binding protein n=1 Tax=Gomphillus americanus TaxID=1940652 RepID=A0A8H3ETP1_9LECA|nr:MAG: hypothetical protein GOMPHAMPRED_006276 [Gomphillus americanus]
MSSPHIVFITGANTGIGLETVRALAKTSTPYTIILGGRTLSKVEEAITSLRTEIPSTSSTYSAVQIDLEDDTSIQTAFETISAAHTHLDTLINNAGAAFDYDLHAGKLSMRQAWNKSWDVNVTGTFIVTWTFAPLLVKSPLQPRLLFLTSGTASVSETEAGSGPANHLTKSPSKGWPKTDLGFDVTSYRSSKVGLNMMMRQWERILREDGVKVFAISPGFLVTGLGNMGQQGREMMKNMGAGEASVGGEFIRDVVEGMRDADAGKAIRKDMVQPW